MLAVFFACFVFFLFYHFAVRRVLLDQVRFKLFALRDDVRDLAIDRKINPAGFAYNHIERSLCNLINVAELLNIYRFGQFVIWQKHIPVPSRDVRFKETAPGVLKDIEDRAIDGLFWVLLINSPLGAIIIGFALGVAYGLAKLNSGISTSLAWGWKYLVAQARAFLDREFEDSQPHRGLVGARTT